METEDACAPLTRAYAPLRRARAPLRGAQGRQTHILSQFELESRQNSSVQAQNQQPKARADTLNLTMTNVPSKRSSMLDPDHPRLAGESKSMLYMSMSYPPHELSPCGTALHGNLPSWRTSEGILQVHGPSFRVTTELSDQLASCNHGTQQAPPIVFVSGQGNASQYHSSMHPSCFLTELHVH